jgi:hypothetical protein
MNGQWIGTYTGTNAGTIILNIDNIGNGFHGMAYLNESNLGMPSTAAVFEVQSTSQEFKFKTLAIFPINPSTGLPDSWESLKALFPNVTPPKEAECEGIWDEVSLRISWKTDIGTFGSATIPRSKATAPSQITPRVMTWSEYKQHVLGLEGRRFIFRGQNVPARLRTSFHRTGRADLQRFLHEDIPSLHKHLSARTNHIFNLKIPEQNGAFFNLVQHHGYPTPLLDWSYSPYVAEFFAFRGISNEAASQASESDVVRIYLLDQALWKKDWNQLYQLTNAGLHFSVSEFLAMENERMIPQQAVSTVTNVDDIEGYIKEKAELKSAVYLYAIDICKAERRSVLHELAYMGITAGSLFPGLDGACEELRERNFHL